MIRTKLLITAVLLLIIHSLHSQSPVPGPLAKARQKEIVDSIRYAKRIRQALMPPTQYFKKSKTKK